MLLPFFALGTVKGGENNPPVLFFSLIIAYIIPVFSFITARARDALDDLRPLLTIEPEEFFAKRQSLDSLSPQESLLWLACAAFSGLCHMAFMRGSFGAAITSTFSNMAGFMSSAGALLTWIVMTTVIVKLIQQAMIFSSLGANRVRVSLINFESLLPFGRVAITASLAIIGALALFPLINMGDSVHLSESVPGAVAVLFPLLVMFVIPVWPLHRRLRRLKEAELLRVNAEIARKSQGHSVGVPPEQALAVLSPLLTYRHEIAKTPTWPFDLGNVARLFFYLIIIPLTWIGAALIENVVDAFL
ncbi:MAG: hypothetical protein AB8C02_16900 [Halioglobus sp.]